MPRDGRYELRVTNELEETLFLDRLQLVAVDHPAGVEVYPREGCVRAAVPGFQLYAAARRAGRVARAIDDAGRDVTARLARAPIAQFVDDLPLEPIRGYAKPHALTLDLGAAPPATPRRCCCSPAGPTTRSRATTSPRTRPACRCDPPSLQVRDASGRWQTAIAEIGIPVGRPQTIVVDLTDAALRRRARGAAS